MEENCHNLSISFCISRIDWISDFSFKSYFVSYVKVFDQCMLYHMFFPTNVPFCTTKIVYKYNSKCLQIIKLFSNYIYCKAIVLVLWVHLSRLLFWYCLESDQLELLSVAIPYTSVVFLYLISLTAKLVSMWLAVMAIDNHFCPWSSIDM